jgi:hypothetical protein
MDQEMKRYVQIFVAAILLGGFGGLVHAASVVDASTLNKKVMAGYQGWFMTSNDGSGVGWRHWSRQTPNASNISFEMWPDLREYSPSELTATSLNYHDGTNAGLYSAYNPGTVDRHVKWMQDYSIDGVFVQRFIGEAIYMRSVRDKVLQNVRSSSEKYGRVFANMYDISGGNASTLVSDIKSDWMHLVDDLKLTQSSRYLRHAGLPVVSVWGFGFGDRAGSAAQLKDLTGWFKSGAPAQYRATVKLGVDPDWRSHSPEWQAAYRSAAIISPWSVGRYSNDSGADNFRSNNIAPDLAALKGTSIGYMPVIWPGFSWWNLKHGSSPFNQVPRNGGRFFWRQAYNAQAAGSNMVYVAMFDEIDEGTAMFKIAENASQVPTTGKFLTLNADGENLPSDWYLRLMGEATRMLKGQRSLVSNMPPNPIDDPGTGGDSSGIGTPTSTSSLQVGKQLRVGQRIASPNGQYHFDLQGDGNLVTYSSAGKVVWTANTQGKGGTRLVLQSDGNLVLYTSAGKVVWASGTHGKTVSYLILQNDGILVLQSSEGATVWSK